MDDKELRPFCKDCAHCFIDPSIKLTYNKYVKDAFHNCPETEVKVVGCFTKNLQIDWENFTQWCYDNKIIKPTAQEATKANERA